MLPQFYNKASVLNSKQHQNLSLKPISDLSFAAKSNVLFIQANEFTKAMSAFPIVFVGSDEKLAPVVLTGVQQNQNLFVDSTGKWRGEYLPSYIKRFPFIMADGKDDQVVVCIDDSYEGFNENGEGHRLFDDNHQPSQFLKGAIQFLEHFEQSYSETRFLAKTLQELDLLEPLKAEFKPKDPNQGMITVEGFQVVSREQLAKLSGDQLADLRDKGVLELIYHHLGSLKIFDKLLAIYQHQQRQG
jgi:hypothetical protein